MSAYHVCLFFDEHLLTYYLLRNFILTLVMMLVLGQRTFFSKAYDLRALLRDVIVHRVSVQVGDLHPAVLPQLPGVELSQRRHHGGLRHRMGDVGALPHLQSAQDVPLDRLQQVRVQPARFGGLLRLSDAARRTAILGRSVRLPLGSGTWRSSAEDASREHNQSEQPTSHFLFENE